MTTVDQRGLKLKTTISSKLPTKKNMILASSSSREKRREDRDRNRNRNRIIFGVICMAFVVFTVNFRLLFSVSNKYITSYSEEASIISNNPRESESNSGNANANEIKSLRQINKDPAGAVVVVPEENKDLKEANVNPTAEQSIVLQNPTTSIMEERKDPSDRSNMNNVGIHTTKEGEENIVVRSEIVVNETVFANEIEIQVTEEKEKLHELLETMDNKKDIPVNKNTEPTVDDNEGWRIPHRTVFIHTLYEKAEDMPELFYNNIVKTHRIYTEYWEKILGDKNYEKDLGFITEKDCVRDINDTEPELLEFYLTEPRGNNKANICRVAHLYKFGGYYFDVDMGAIQAVPVDKHVTFITPYEYKEPGAPRHAVRGLFNSFLACSPKNPILKTNLDIYLSHYKKEKDFSKEIRDFNYHFGTGSLGLAFKNTEIERNNVVVNMDLEEKRFLSSNRNKYPRVSIPRGKGCCCDFYVEDTKRNEMYFWSRIVGSNSMCDFYK